MSRIVDGVIYDTNKNFVAVFKGDPRHALAAANMKLPAEVRADEYIETEHVIILGEMVYRKSRRSGDTAKVFAGLVKDFEESLDGEPSSSDATSDDSKEAGSACAGIAPQYGGFLESLLKNKRRWLRGPHDSSQGLEGNTALKRHARGHIPLLGGRPERGLPIGKDDCINLKIALETSRSLREFLYRS